ncbi:hypothetical protein [Clostridium botulinum]|uniref:Card1 CARF domain-containing protein n=1 Tax=Clostridium botulinum (strain Langeland / NCTC 10281 / Type F) TaxID=441772 RepID=A7GFA8_CLOBL|nr:hypothetical protein [Clostridium botulinum]ABS42804.1 hypothetical protein CLI_2218 [Clostridium botulinum F str. Langeland]ADF99871.1 hypothetical protein CBF_2203 [Clostridium botulinum F str. 230613]KKM42556.1 hypothetical protein VT72_02635 [Clostridium botulinum]MBY6792959.1 hypothetical protein [Clostridium botulinum]MBY6937168.1 hypothetical protein [Clostridium botulinum]
MEHKNVEHLVIFSTLNQITNYIAIKNLKPKNIYNITFDQGFADTLKQGIDPKKWDDNLKNVLNDENIKPKRKNIEIKQCMYIDLEKFKEELEKNIEYVDEDTPIYWHITGGQRIFAIAIHDIVKKRPNDIIFYLEGNSEKIIYIGKEKTKFEYELKDLDFSTAFKLMGYNTEDLDSTRILKGKIKKNDKNEKLKYDKNEMKFYHRLYDWIINNDGEKTKSHIAFSIGDKKFEGTFKKLLLESNSINRTIRQEFLKKLFEELEKKSPSLKKIEYNFINSDEMKMEFPAGYIFEKLTGYQIYKVVEDNTRILGMAMSLKVYNEEGGHSTDELDIALLTNTGRIINFECKSGSLKGDNAKSHKFTTYSLSGVFGAPIFLTPLTYKGEKLEKELDKKLHSACKAADRANLEKIYLKDIKEKVKKLIG